MNKSEPPQLNDTLANNPYIDAVRLFYSRLRWDLNPYAWASKKRLKQLKGSKKGEKAVILCNGPSLNKVDFSLLSETNTYTFGLNQIYRYFDKLAYIPSCMVMIDGSAVQIHQDFLNSTDLPVFVTHKGLKWVKPRPNTTFLHEVRTKKFARDLSMSIYGGYTVTFAALQLAYHMGFDAVALVGCDHNYFAEGTDKFKDNQVKEEDRAKYYLDPSYMDMKGLEAKLGSNKAESEYSYHMAFDAFFYAGRPVFNATEGGNLDVFPRLSLKDFLRNDE